MEVSGELNIPSYQRIAETRYYSHTGLEYVSQTSHPTRRALTYLVCLPGLGMAIGLLCLVRTSTTAGKAYVSTQSREKEWLILAKFTQTTFTMTRICTIPHSSQADTKIPSKIKFFRFSTRHQLQIHSLADDTEIVSSVVTSVALVPACIFHKLT